MKEALFGIRYQNKSPKVSHELKLDMREFFKRVKGTARVEIPFPNCYGTYVHENLELLAEHYDILEEDINWAETYSRFAEEYAKEFLKRAKLWGNFYSFEASKDYTEEDDKLYVEMTIPALLELETQTLKSAKGWPEDWGPEQYLEAFIRLDIDDMKVTEHLFKKGKVQIILRGDNT